MTGFTSNSSQNAGQPINFDEFVKGLAQCLRLDGVKVSASEDRMHIAMGFGMQDAIVIALEPKAENPLSPAQLHREAKGFAEHFNKLFLEPGEDGKLYPSEGSPVASVMDDGKIAINAERVKAMFRQDASHIRRVLQHTLNYSSEQPEKGDDATMIIPPPPKLASTFGFTATGQREPSISSDAVFARIKEGAEQMKWGGVEVEVTRQNAHNSIGFSISDTHVQLSFKGEGVGQWTEAQHYEEALNFADYLQQFISRQTGSFLGQDIITATKEGKVEIGLEQLRPLVRHHPEILDGVPEAMQSYARTQVMQREQEPVFAMSSIEKGLAWLLDISRMFEADAVPALMDRADAGQAAKFNQFCAELGQYVQMKAEAPEKFAEIQRDYPVYARTVEAYEGYLQRQQKQVVGETQAPASPTWVEACNIKPGLRVNRQPDGSFGRER